MLQGSPAAPEGANSNAIVSNRNCPAPLDSIIESSRLRTCVAATAVAISVAASDARLAAVMTFASIAETVIPVAAVMFVRLAGSAGIKSVLAFICAAVTSIESTSSPIT